MSYVYSLHRVEKQAINSVIKMCNQSKIYTGEDLALSVVKMDLNMTNHSVAPLVRLPSHIYVLNSVHIVSEKCITLIIHVYSTQLLMVVMLKG